MQVFTYFVSLLALSDWLEVRGAYYTSTESAWRFWARPRSVRAGRI